MASVMTAQHLAALVREIAPEVVALEEAERKGRGATPCGLFVKLLDPAVDLVMARDASRLEPVLDLVERCCAEGDEEVDTAACTCFLESLSNRLGWNAPHLKPWVRERLGPRSAAFWDIWETT